MVKIRIARSAEEMDSFRPLWERLEKSNSCTLFQSFAWNRLVASRFPAREDPYVVCAESDSGAAIIPAAIADYGLTLLGEALFDYRDVLHLGDPEVLRRAWQELARLRLPLFFTALRGAARRSAWDDLRPQPFVNAPCVLLSDVENAEQFAANHNRLGRCRRRLERQGVHFSRQNAPSPESLRHVYQLKADQLPGSLFRDPARLSFITAAANLDPTSCDLYTLRRDDCLVAALVTFRDGPTRRFYTIYYDHQWAHFSPGVVLLFEATRQSLAEGLDCDYMTGEQPHKARLATSSVPLFRVEATCESLAMFSGLEEQPVPELAA